MLDSETKSRIDNCRNILVGKVPDPKSQVEQITIALIYKFMDDMDAESEELGGERKFFAGQFARFGWPQLMTPSLGGFEVLALYSEAISKMNENPGVPELFRDIFKNAYLPYRDPETLKSFLKEINTFTYDHSERLGDAFEYLLSVLGSQGDAGQFRTPRHIIDFMVEVIAPQKHETILDPACGTAGFLISAWKHILAANTSAGAKVSGDKLTPDERSRLAHNIKGYDISPDMVRLSLVNLYLHGFADPDVVEYDTLTQDDKWNELADVILANPPFMSPKGGIKPHKRFTVQASRSEVLFVDYMAEHLTATGRAAIVVPEGIIFQSGTAYKALRKMLIDTSLTAVVSLPAGVFNPYSGVKTSILILDKRVHKQTDKVLFVKVQNDGFNLGAQRRAMANSDLPEATRLLRGWLTAPDSFEGDGVVAQAVTRDRIAEGGDFNLSGDRYLQEVAYANQIWPTVALSEFCTLQRGLSYTTPELGHEGSGTPFYNLKSIKRQGTPQKTDFKYFTGEIKDKHIVALNDILIALTDLTPTSELIGSPKLITDSIKAAYSADLAKIVFADKRVLPEFLYQLLRSAQYRSYIVTFSHGANVKHLQAEGFMNFRIPLPSLEVQDQIVAEIADYQKVIDGARQVVDNYKPQIAIDPSWPKEELGQFAKLINGRAYKQEELLSTGPTPVLRVGNFFSNRSWYFSDLELEEEKYCNEGDLLYAWSASFGPRIWEGPRAIYHYHIWKVEVTERVEKRFLYYLLELDSVNIKAEGSGIAMVHATKGGMEKRKFPLPDIETQRGIVNDLDAEQELVDANRELIRRMEAKIKFTLDRVWGS